MKLYGLLTALAVFLLTAHCVRAQDSSRTLPEVISHQGPIYPPLARQARIGGPVHLTITTDGHTVTRVAVIDGHPLLVKAATDSVQTWKFADHIPGTFDVTFSFTSLKDKITFLQEPGVVDIAVLAPQYNENTDDRLDYTLPVSWDLELKTTTDNIKAKLIVWTYGPWLRGYTAGPGNQERVIGQAHVAGDMLGFDAALDDSHGQQLRFSLIGRKAGDRIQGIFLDAWGASGTWTAVPSKPPDPLCAAGSAVAQENDIPVPEITQHRRPDYPMIPWEAHIEGQVRMRVSADSYCVGKIVTQSSEPLLAQAAEANVRTWWFDFHKPGTFSVTFSYRVLRPGVSFLEKPGVVEISEVPPSTGGPVSGLWNGFHEAGQPETWKAQLTSPRGRIQATFHFTYGCCQVGDVETKGRKEEVNQGHSFGGEVGFSTAIRTANNRPTRVSLIGRRSAEQMRGVFLDDSGTSGTWTARSEPAPPPPLIRVPEYNTWKAHFRLVDTLLGKKSALLDNATGLEWLQLKFTANRSYDQVVKGLDRGGDFEGWRVATVPELQAFFSHFTGTADGHSSDRSIERALQRVLGGPLDHDADPNTGYTSGIVGNPSLPAEPNRPVLYNRGFVADDSEFVTIDPDTVVNLMPGHISPSLGTFLVRAH